MPQATLSSISAPRQARSHETLRRLLDAAESLIEEKGLADASIPEIVRRAGSSVGGFYARFRDKDALFRALEERFFLDLYARLDAISSPARWHGASLGEIVRPSVEELVRAFRERAPLIRCFLVRAARDPGTFEDGLRFRRDVAARFVALAAPRRQEIRHPQPELAVELGVQLAFGLMQQAVILGEVRAGGRVLDDADLVEEITRNFLAYLGLDEPGDETAHGIGSTT
jgi:AcrR family transcriptional regulator